MLISLFFNGFYCFNEGNTLPSGLVVNSGLPKVIKNISSRTGTKGKVVLYFGSDFGWLVDGENGDSLARC